MVQQRKILSKGGQKEAGEGYGESLSVYLGEFRQRIGQKDYPAEAQKGHPS